MTDRGYIIGHTNIKTTSSIILTRTRNVFRFSCKTPIFLSGCFKNSNNYRCDLVIPKILFNQSSCKVFEGVRRCEKNCIIIHDILDKNIKIHASARIDSAIDNDMSMYVITFDIHPTIDIPNPVIFICGILIRIKYINSIVKCEDICISGIKLFINEYSRHTTYCN